MSLATKTAGVWRRFGWPMRAILILSSVTFLAGMSGAGERDVRDGPGSDAPKSQSPKVRARMGSDHITLGQKPVTVELSSVPAPKGERALTLPETVRALASDRKLYLVVRDLRTNAQPGVTYSLYLDLPPRASPEAAQKHFAGNVNFFSATVTDDPAKAESSDRFVSFDVTPLLKALDADGKLKDVVTLTIIPDDTPAAAAKPWIGEVSLLEQ
jgi:hypothetical protein